MIEKGVVFEGQCKMEGIDKGAVKAAPPPVQAVKP
jgi:hypothetical protein